MEQLTQTLKTLEKRLFSFEKKLNIDQKTRELGQLEAESTKGDFWTDINRATKTMAQISFLKQGIETINNLKDRLKDALALADLKTQDMTPDLEKEAAQIEQQIADLEFSLFLSGTYDAGSALLSLHAGQGGVEAMDWTQMLLRMYLRFSERKNWKTSLISETRGEEAGIKSATIEIDGLYAYGHLKNEAGTHRLVRRSPFNADHLRQTSFALVEVMPVIEEVRDIAISPDDLEVETFRASAPGGQNVQKVETAVRIRHQPSQIVATAQSERSQAQNKENALKLLRAKLFSLQEEKREREQKKLKGEFKTASWGNQIRNYVLHPYKLMKDLRTGVESNDPQAVLDGEMEKFIEAGVKLK